MRRHSRLSRGFQTRRSFAVEPLEDRRLLTAVIGVAKDASWSGREVTLDFYLENFGDEVLSDISLPDNLDEVFGSDDYEVISGPTFVDDPGTLTLNPSFDGNNNTDLISAGTLGVGDTAQIRVVVEVEQVNDMGMGRGIYSNQVTASALGPMEDATEDVSDFGTDPDPNGNGDPGDEDEADPTPIDITENPIIGAAKNATLDGTQVTLDYYLENFGNRPLGNVSLPDNLDAVFGAGNYTLLTPPFLVQGSEGISVNDGFDGSSDTELIEYGTLFEGETVQIQIAVDITNVTDQGAGTGVYSNQVTASGQAPSGTVTTDLSDGGTDPDPSGDNDPTDPGENDPTVFVIGQEPVIGIAKSATVVGSQVTLDIFLENLGNVDLTNVALEDDLDAVFGAGNYQVVAGPTLIDDPGTIFVNAAFDGSGDTVLIPAEGEDDGRGGGDPVPASALEIGATAQIQIVVTVGVLSDQGLGTGNYRNQVTVTAEALGGGLTSDVSDDGTDPDPNGNGDPTEQGENDPTDFTVGELPVIGVAKDVEIQATTSAIIDVEGQAQQGTGPKVVLTWYLQNLGNVELSNVTLTDDLDAVFGAGNYGTVFSVLLPEIVSSDGTINVNTSYNGSTETNVLAAGSTLNPGSEAVVRTEVIVTTITDQGLGIGVYQNQATASAEGPSGGQTSDLSDAGTLPDPNGNGNPSDSGEDDPFEFVVGSSIGVAKDVEVSGNQVIIDLYLENFGTADLGNVTLTDDIENVFGTGNFTITAPPAFIDDPGTLTLNAGYDGGDDQDLLAAGGTLAAGDTAQIQLTVTVDEIINRGNGLGQYSNQATVTATQPGGIVLMDSSDAGTDPDPSGNDDPTEAGENDANTFTVASDAVVGVAKDVAIEGNQITIDLYLVNYGNAASNNVTLTDDLDAVFGPGNHTIAVAPAFIDDPGTLVLNGAYDGSSDIDLLAPGGSLAAGDTAQIQFVVNVTNVTDQGLGVGVYENQATVSGTDSNGAVISDLSDFGTDPDPTDDGDPTTPGQDDPPVDGDDDPTGFFIGDATLGAALHSFVSGNQVTFDYYLENLGDVEITDFSVVHSLLSPFGINNVNVTQTPVLLEGPATFDLNEFYDGIAQSALIFDGSLDVGESARIRTVVDVTDPGTYTTGFTADGLDPSGGAVSDVSDDGILTDPNGNGDPTESGENDATVIVIGEGSTLGVSKTATVDVDQVTFDYYLENLGNVTVSSVSLPEDLDAVFGAGNWAVNTAPALIVDPGTLTLDGSWDGSGNTDLLVAGSSSLAAGSTAQIQVVVDVTAIVDQGLGVGLYENQVVVSGQGPSSTVTQDLSDNGTDPDPNGNGNPADVGEGDPTSFSLNIPRIGVAKNATVVGREVTLDYFVENMGTVTLSNLSLTEDLDAVFGAGNYTLVSGPTLMTGPRDLVLNSGFDGSSDTQLIDSGTTSRDSTEQIRIVVEVTTVTDQGFGLGIYQNQVTVIADGPEAEIVSDISDEGTDPDPNGNDLPNDSGEDDPTNIALRSSIGDSVWVDLNDDGTRDAGEPGLAGVTVFLDTVNVNGEIDEGEPTEMTDADGNYRFSDLAAGNYIVDVDSATVPTGFTLSTDRPLPVTVSPGEDLDDADFGYRQADMVGVHRNRIYFLDVNANGRWDKLAGGDTVQAFGAIGDIPVIGDWNGDGYDEVGSYRESNSKFYLDLNGSGRWEGPAGGDIAYIFGVAGVDKPIVGDWDGDGIDELGAFRPTNGKFYLDLNSDGRWSGPEVDGIFPFGEPGDIPLSGDWNGDRIDDLGVYRGNEFRLDANGNRTWDGTGPGQDVIHTYRDPGEAPVIGDWDGDGVDQIGTRANQLFFVDYNNNGTWDRFAGGDVVYNFGGLVTDIPIAGKWAPIPPPLLAAPNPAAQTAARQSVERLTEDALAPVVERAVEIWSDTALSADQRSALADIDVQLANLPGPILGQTLGNTIIIDVDAAGWGWFVEKGEGQSAKGEGRNEIPHSDFRIPHSSGSPLSALDSRLQMDLLTAVLHELGHVVGLDDDYSDIDSDDLMNGWLEAGERRDLAAAAHDHLFAEKDWWNGRA